MIAVAQLIVRNIDESVVEELKIRAARHGRSAEAEHREILRQALQRSPGRTLKQHLLEIPKVGEDDDFDIPRDVSRSVEL